MQKIKHYFYVANETNYSNYEFYFNLMYNVSC